MPRRPQPNPLAAAVGRRVRAFRETNGLNLEKLAFESGLSSKGHLSDIEHGKVIPTVASLAPLAERLGVQLLDLVTFPEADDRQRLVDLTRGLPPDVIQRFLTEAEKSQRAATPAETARPVEIHAGRKMPRGSVPVIELEADGEVARDVASARWVRLETSEATLPGAFVAQVFDDSMAPRFLFGGYGLFRRPAPGNRQGRVFLVTYRDHAGVRQRGLKYVEKGVFSGRERIVLRSLNPAQGPVLVDPVGDDFRILGELVRTVVISDRA